MIFTKTELWLQAAQCPGLEQHPFEAGGKRRRRDVVIRDLNGKSEWLPVARLTALTAVTCDDGMTPCRASTPLPPMLRSLTFGLWGVIPRYNEARLPRALTSLRHLTALSLVSSNHIVRGCSEGDDTGEGRGDIKVPLDLITRIPALRSFTVKGVRAIWRWPADRHVTFPALEELDMLWAHLSGLLLGQRLRRYGQSFVSCSFVMTYFV